MLLALNFTKNGLCDNFMIFKTLLNTEVIAQKCSAKRSKEFRNVAEEDTHDNKRIEEFSK